MRRGLLLMMAMFPLVASAADVAPMPDEWTYCTQDDECAVVKGMCGPATVRVGYEQVAQMHYKQRAESTKCPQAFWRPAAKDATARCRLERCEIVAKNKAK